MATPPSRQGPSPRSVSKTSPEYGRGTHAIEPAELELADPSELRATLLAIFRAPNYKPPVLPSVAVELTELTRKSSVSYDDVIGVLQKDPLIVAGVLKLAQSPLYGGRTPVQSLKEALQRLGINTLRDMVWQVAASMRLFRVKSYAGVMERVQAHSMFTAHMARIVATQAGIAAEHAFLCGLLHDVGISGGLIALAESAKTAPRLAGLWPALDAVHDEAGELMAKLWGLSPEIVAALGGHHRLEPGKKPATILLPVLCVTEALADACGYGLAALAGAEAPAEPIDRQLGGRYEYAMSCLRLAGKERALADKAEELRERLGGGG